ncbi:MAG: hypothetical protein D3909_03285 [Candidatus Electrothrix sp. ATG1]|nr:hypothetical protein [Candidatus Electrothrix sp. ATG1]
MAIPFSQTLESRRYDISKLFMIGMLVAVPFSVLWGYWFCTASVPVYETTRRFRISDKEVIRNFFPRTGGGGMRTQSLKNRKIFAVFPAKAIKNITRYQQGYFFPEPGEDTKSGAVLLTVLDIIPGHFGKKDQVVLLAEYPVDQTFPFADRTEGKICIAVGQTTPMKILAQSSGLLQEKSLPVTYLSQRTAQ